MVYETDVKDVVIISDTHFGCSLALCPPEIRLTDKGLYRASSVQVKIYEYFMEVVNEWLPHVVGDRPFDLVHVGDLIDYVHHRSITQISHNILDHHLIAIETLSPLVEKAKRIFILRGTEAHSGSSSVEEERFGYHVGSIQDEFGNYSHYRVDYRLGDYWINFMHHISVGNVSNSELTAISRELHEIRLEHGKWGSPMPHVVVRGHRHRHAQASFPSVDGYIYGFTCGSWQAMTPFSFKGNSRVKFPHFLCHHITFDKFGLRINHSPVRTVK